MTDQTPTVETKKLADFEAAKFLRPFKTIKPSDRMRFTAISGDLIGSDGEMVDSYRCALENIAEAFDFIATRFVHDQEGFNEWASDASESDLFEFTQAVMLDMGEGRGFTPGA